MPLETRIPEIIEAAPGKIERAIDDTMDEVIAGATARSRYDEKNDEPEHLHMKDAWRSRKRIKLSLFEGVVFNLKEYAIYNEFGTRWMSPQPMVRPAMIEAREPYQERMLEVWS